ncbi:MAG: YraN family protein [Parcubacteria group bacterium]|nr:YraN family protein [Parcubacteria group bacterium]
MAPHNKIGTLGENIACRYLENRGFDIIERNYRKPWGEIDIISVKNGFLHFIEVKTVTRVTSNGTQRGEFRPEDAVHRWKQERMRRVIQSYLSDYKKRNVTRVTDQNSGEQNWQFDIVAIELNLEQKTSKVRFLEQMTL